MSHRSTHLTSVLIVSTVALAIGISIAGCGKIRQLDAQVWGTADAPAESPPGAAPPVLELAAGVLAALGYGGMAGWIHRNRKRSDKISSTRQAALREDIAAAADAARLTSEGLMMTLEQHIDGEGHVRDLRPKTGPLAKDT